MTQELVRALYEQGRTVGQIAEASGHEEIEVTALLEPDMGTEDLMRQTDLHHHQRLRRVRALADGLTLEYLEKLRAVIDDLDSTDEQRADAFAEMDKVLRIAKQYSDRVLLAEGKTTENIGVEGSVGLPFNVVITKTYEGPAEPESS